MLKKRTFLVLIVVLMLAVPLAQGQDEAITITFWNGFSAHEVDILNDMIEQYWNPAHPNIIVKAEGEKDNNTILTAMAGGDPPDVIMAPSSEVVTLWAHQGAIMDLTDAVAPIQDQLEEDLVAASLDWVRYKGSYYGLPFVNYNWGMYYNQDLFAEAGLDPDTPPQTIEELEEYARKLTKFDDDGNITQLGWMPLTDEWSALNFVMSFGGQFVDEEGNPTVNDEAIVRAFEWDVNLAREFGLEKVLAFTAGFTEGDNPFQLGKVAMYIDGCWMVKFNQEYAPDVSFGVTAVPSPDPAFANANDVGTNPIAIPVGGKHIEEAMEFAVFFATNADISREYSDLISNLPQIKSEIETFTDDPKTQFFAEYSNSPNARAWAPVPYSQQYLDEFISVIGQIYYQGVNPMDALNATQENLEYIAEEYK